MGVSKFNLDEFEFEIEESNKLKYCKKCKTENVLSAKFCLECGCTDFVSSLKKKTSDKYCVKCKTKLENKAKFCFNCGGNEFVSSLDDIDDYYVKEMDSKWQEELDKINKKIDKANKEITELNFKKEDYVIKINNLKKNWEAKISSLNSENINTLNKANSYTNESSGYVKKIAKLKEQVEALEKKYNDLSNKQNVDKTKEKELDNTFDDILSIFGGSSLPSGGSPLPSNIIQYVLMKSPRQMYNSAVKLEKENKPDVAFLVYQEAAKKEHPESQNRLGCIYYERATKDKEGVFGNNYKEALKWFTKSAENGYFYGMINTGRCYLEAKGTSCDEEEAIKWFQKAVKAKNSIKSEAYYYLGRCFELMRYEKETVDYYNKADNYESYKRLAYIYYEGVFKIINYPKAYDYALKAYGDGSYDPDGEVGNLLGKLYLSGKGVASNSKKAYELFTKSAIERNNIDAYYNLALCYLNGFGVQKNSTKAKKYLDIAAKKGHSNALKKLKEL